MCIRDRLQAAKTKADSINLALSANLKTSLKDGIEDQDVEIKVDKTVVMINLSDKMLYQSGSSNLTARATEAVSYTHLDVYKRQPLDRYSGGRLGVDDSCRSRSIAGL